VLFNFLKLYRCFRGPTHWIKKKSLFDYLEQRQGNIAVIISPLVALMKDQVEKFSALGICAVCIGNCTSEVEQQVESGEYQLVFVSPETLLLNLKNPIYQEKLVSLVSDEARCV
jgi:superfamily II DNA helicase RecQ